MDGPLPPDMQRTLESGFSHLVANKYYVLASTVMLVYDHLLTFEREHTYIWNQKKTVLFYLFFTFRYVTPIISILNIVAEHDPTWSGPRCKNWIWLPVATGPIISAATGVILILRVHAIYARSNWILYVTIPIYLGQLVVMAWSVPAGVPVSLPPGFVGCIPGEKPGTGHRLSATYIAALVFDAMIFLLTLGRALYLRFTDSTLALITLIVRDGTLYFTVIFVVNLINVFLLLFAPSDLGAINAPFASMITAILVARLVLNLREAGFRQRVSSEEDALYHGSISAWRPATRPDIGVSSLVRPRRTVTHGWASSFRDATGFGEFDLPLGRDNETRSTGEDRVLAQEQDVPYEMNVRGVEQSSVAKS